MKIMKKMNSILKFNQTSYIVSGVLFVWIIVNALYKILEFGRPFELPNMVYDKSTGFILVGIYEVVIAFLLLFKRSNLTGYLLLIAYYGSACSLNLSMGIFPYYSVTLVFIAILITLGSYPNLRERLIND
jgi:hypothetical protein